MTHSRTTRPYVLDAQHGVLLVGTERHQDALRRHAPTAGSPAQVVAELRLVPGPDEQGTPAVDAHLDGDRIGSLPLSDAIWYRPLLEEATRHGLRPVADGHVRAGGAGELVVELFLPAGADPESLVPAQFPSPEPPTPSEPRAGRPRRRGRWLARTAVAVAVLAVLGAVGFAQWPRIVEWTGASRTTTTTTTTTATAAPPSTTVSAPLPTSAPTPTPEPTTAPPAPAVTTSKVLPPITNGGCDPNYSGACVPIASHVECAGPGRAGPLVVRGPFRVTGTDLYQLDPDGDGIACGPVARATPAAAATTRRAAASTAESTPPDEDEDG